MKRVQSGSLQRTMIIYFLLMSFASLLITAEFIFDVHGKPLRSELVQNCEKLSKGSIGQEEAFKPILVLRNKAILMVVLFLVVVLILLMMFIKNITEPLQHMIETTRTIGEGDLSQTIEVRARNELAEMGSTVNELTSNLQEMLLLSKDMCSSVDLFTEKISGLLDSEGMDREKSEELRRGMQRINSKTRLMNEIIFHCKFYGMEK